MGITSQGARDGPPPPLPRIRQHRSNAPLCDIPSGCCSFTGPWTVTRSSLRMLRRVAAFCRSLRPVLLLVSFPRSRSPVVGVLGLCWMWRGVPFARQQRPIIGVLRMCCPPPPLNATPGRISPERSIASFDLRFHTKTRHNAVLCVDRRAHQSRSISFPFPAMCAVRMHSLTRISLPCARPY